MRFRMKVLVFAIVFLVFLYVVDFRTCQQFFSSRMKGYMDRRTLPERWRRAPNNLHDADYSNETKCVLPKMNPFDDSVLKFYGRYKWEIPVTSCDKEFIPRTSLENGLLKPLNSEDYCWGRCLHRLGISNHSYIEDDWISAKLSLTFECDIVETICSKTNDSASADYGYLHTQIYQLKEKQFLVTSRPSARKKYSVLMLVLDSTSSFSAERNLPETLDYLNTEMGAVIFKYLNRVGRNSKPNGAPLFLGKRAEQVLQFDEFSPKWDFNFNLDEICYKNLDEEYPWIHKNFSDEGYVTYLGEDWKMGLFNYPDCYGYNKSVADHISSPYPIAWDFGSKLMRNTLRADNCMFKHARLMNHVEQFVRSYEGIPKFGTYWDTDWAHDSPTALMPADPILKEFFQRNKEHLNDTFVFVMGDHGLRIGAMTKTKIGEYETNNPMLVVVPPEELRQNEELMKTLRENSQKLQTHWDTRATLFDILKYQPGSNFSGRSPLDLFPDGSSYLRRQEGERSCRTLPIPIQYCICSHPTQELNVSSEQSRYFAQHVIESIEDQLKERRVSHLCNKWTFKEVLSLREVTVSEENNFYQITFELNSPPGAQFRTMVSSRNGTLLVGSVDRVDEYNDRGNCVPHELSPICDCL